MNEWKEKEKEKVSTMVVQISFLIDVFNREDLSCTCITVSQKYQ